MNHIFRTTIKDLISRNKFFQCFVCYQQFDAQQKYPMQVCRNHHYMCQECVKSRAFKSKAKGHYKCGLCSVQIKISDIRRNSFILSIKEFFEGLIEREELARERYKDYMENQEKIVEILLQENENVVKEKDERERQVERLKEEVTNLKKKNEEKAIVRGQKEKPVYVNKIQVSEDEDEQFHRLSSQKANQNNPIIMPTNSIFRSNLFNSSFKADNNPQSKKQQQQKRQLIPKQFIPNPAFSQIYYQNNKSQIKPQSVVHRLIQQGKKIKQNLINEQQKSKIKLKESLKELQTHKKYINLERDDEEEQENNQIIEKKDGQPHKKVHLDQVNQKPQPQQKPNPINMKPRNSWFPFA